MDDFWVLMNLSGRVSTTFLTGAAVTVASEFDDFTVVVSKAFCFDSGAVLFCFLGDEVFLDCLRFFRSPSSSRVASSIRFFSNRLISGLLQS
jgi:hypothetical protein